MFFSLIIGLYVTEISALARAKNKGYNVTRLDINFLS